MTDSFEAALRQIKNDRATAGHLAVEAVQKNAVAQAELAIRMGHLGEVCRRLATTLQRLKTPDIHLEVVDSKYVPASLFRGPRMITNKRADLGLGWVIAEHSQVRSDSQPSYSSSSTTVKEGLALLPGGRMVRYLGLSPLGNVTHTLINPGSDTSDDLSDVGHYDGMGYGGRPIPERDPEMSDTIVAQHLAVDRLENIIANFMVDHQLA